VVADCHICIGKIDSSPVMWEKRALGVTGTWKRVASDITHYNNKKYYKFPTTFN